MAYILRNLRKMLVWQKRYLGHGTPKRQRLTTARLSYCMPNVTLNRIYVDVEKMAARVRYLPRRLMIRKRVTTYFFTGRRIDLLLSTEVTGRDRNVDLPIKPQFRRVLRNSYQNNSPWELVRNPMFSIVFCPTPILFWSSFMFCRRFPVYIIQSSNFVLGLPTTLLSFHPSIPLRSQKWVTIQYEPYSFMVLLIKILFSSTISIFCSAHLFHFQYFSP